MSNIQDGLVFVDLVYSGGAIESFNVSSITRIRQLNEEQCKAADRKFPAVKLSIMGMQEDVIIGNLGSKELKKMIQNAIDKHYDSIAEKFLLDGDK